MSFPIFDKLGGPERAIELIASATGKEPTRFAQDKWRAFGVLPSKAALPLVFECQRLGIDTDESDLRWREARGEVVVQ